MSTRVQVFPTSFETFVDKNDEGDVTITQGGGMQDEEDPVIYVPKMHLEALILALQALQE